MRRTLRNLVGWLAATAVAVAVSWTVIRDATGPQTSAAPVPVIPVTGTPPPDPGAGGASRLAPAATSTTAPSPGRSASTPAPTGSSPASTGTSPAARPTPGPSSAGADPAAADPGPDGTAPGPGVHSYRVTGGQVVLRFDAQQAELISAAPADGYQARSWRADGWLRIDFSGQAGTSSVFVTWNGHPPAIRAVEY